MHGRLQHAAVQHQVRLASSSYTAEHSTAQHSTAHHSMSVVDSTATRSSRGTTSCGEYVAQSRLRWTYVLANIVKAKEELGAEVSGGGDGVVHQR